MDRAKQADIHFLDYLLAKYITNGYTNINDTKRIKAVENEERIYSAEPCRGIRGTSGFHCTMGDRCQRDTVIPASCPEMFGIRRR